MIELITGFGLTIISLLIGYSLGAHQTPISPDIQRSMSRLFKKVAPSSPDIGPIERPSAQQNYYRDHPQEAQEQELMNQELEELRRVNKPGFKP